MKKVIKFLIGLGFGLLLFYWIVDKAGVETLNNAAQLFISWQGLVVIALTFIITFISVWRWKVILSCQGEELGWNELTQVWTASYAVNYLTPFSGYGGEAVRTYLSKNVLDVDWQKGFSSVIIDKILDSTFHLLFILIGLVVFLRWGYFPNNLITWIVIVVLLTLTVVLAVFYSRAIGKKSILLLILKLFGLKKTKVKHTNNGEFIFNTEGDVLRFFSPRKAFFWKGVGISFLRQVGHYLRILVLVIFLVEFVPIKTFAVQGMGNLSLLLPLPAGLGGLEAVSAFGFQALDLGFENGTTFAMNWRGADLVICLLGVGFGAYLSLRLFKERMINFLNNILQ